MRVRARWLLVVVLAAVAASVAVWSPSGAEQTGAVVWSPSAAQQSGTAWTAYVTNLNSASVTPIDVATNTPGDAIPVGDFPLGVAVTPDGATAYVANTGSNTVTPIDVATNTPGDPIPVGDFPLGSLSPRTGPPPTSPITNRTL